MKKLIFLFLVLPLSISAQNSSMEKSGNSISQLNADPSIVDVTFKSGVENQELQTYYQFENIDQTEFFIKGDAIKGKYYVLRMKEFLNGELIKTSTLLDERGNEYFKQDTSALSLKLFTKIGKDDIKVWLRNSKMGSKQSYFPTNNDNGRYVAKNFFGAKDLLKEDASDSFYIMSVITPNRNPDGSGSYCRVAQSEIAPEQFGNEFKIPHYYLIEIEFMKE
ncbi:hypothetical protein [Christiangramia sp. SM2212]|uniref:Uncharacterized protein n=1 Tax=Christiangramia sediminicola TaxID=3073267 RepID=A0ABU1EL24_9FLAO|nr:hypothetical protein [Christiangramia sp. SM2212]MDR5589077.1 hypothetical protein [Christiangramia sp. SM2212]